MQDQYPSQCSNPRHATQCRLLTPPPHHLIGGLVPWLRWLARLGRRFQIRNSPRPAPRRPAPPRPPPSATPAHSQPPHATLAPPFGLATGGPHPPPALRPPPPTPAYPRPPQPPSWPAGARGIQNQRATASSAHSAPPRVTGSRSTWIPAQLSTSSEKCDEQATRLKTSSGRLTSRRPDQDNTLQDK